MLICLLIFCFSFIVELRGKLFIGFLHNYTLLHYSFYVFLSVASFDYLLIFIKLVWLFWFFLPLSAFDGLKILFFWGVSKFDVLLIDRKFREWRIWLILIILLRVIMVLVRFINWSCAIEAVCGTSGAIWIT